MALTVGLKVQFVELATQLSPENISCDGERSQAQIRAARKKINAEWQKLEKLAGCQVSEDETYKWTNEIRAYHAQLRVLELSQYPTHPLLKLSNPGVWSRESTSGSSKYYIHKRNSTKLKLAGREVVIAADVKFKLYCNIAYVMGDKELLGEYNTLNECVEAGEAFIASVTFELFKQKRPQYKDENIFRELKRIE